MIGFGIDLAGYTTGNTALAVVEIEGASVKATLLRGSAFEPKRKSNDLLAGVVSEEVAVLRRCLDVGPVAVDIPIDLQGLPFPANAERIWQLTLRPIDRALKAMPAFADRIGAPVARFAAIIREGNFERLLGERLFEAYPAGTFRQLGIKSGQNKGAQGAESLNSLCTTLKMTAPVEDDHDIDAIICAIAAAAPADAICGAEMLKVKGPMPKGFRIPKSLLFSAINVSDCDFDTWMKAREASAQ